MTTPSKGFPRSLGAVYERLEAVEEAGVGEITSDSITDATETGRQIIKAANADAAKTVLAIGNATTATKGLVNQLEAITGLGALTATSDTVSSATTVAALLTDHNDLVSRYNALVVDVNKIRTVVNDLLVKARAAGILNS